MKEELGIEIELALIKERIIEVKYYLLQAIDNGDKQKVQKYKIELDSLIKLYLK